MIHGTKKSKKQRSQAEVEADNALSAKISKHLREFMEVRNREKKDLAHLNQFTQILMELCSDIATIYNFRRELIEEQLKGIPEPELQAKLLEGNLKLTTKLIKGDPKSYVIWSFRQWLVTKLFVLTKTSQVVEGELELCRLMLLKDEKNFHVWNYRHWLNSLTVDIDRAIKFVHEKIKANPFNFSPYHFLTKHLIEKYAEIGGNHEIIQYGMEKKVFEEELDMVRTAVGMNPQEQAPWNFYKWMIRRALACRVIDIKPVELGFHITINFKVYSFVTSVVVFAEEGVVSGWDLRSATGAQPSTSWILEVAKEDASKKLRVEVASNFNRKEDHIRTEYGYFFIGTTDNQAVLTESKRILNEQIAFIEEVYNEEQGKCRFAALTLLQLFRLFLHVCSSKTEWDGLCVRAAQILQKLEELSTQKNLPSEQRKGRMYLLKLAEAWRSLTAGTGPQLREEESALLLRLKPS